MNLSICIITKNEEQNIDRKRSISGTFSVL